jgi:putative acetyltransferase
MPSEPGQNVFLSAWPATGVDRKSSGNILAGKSEKSQTMRIQNADTSEFIDSVRKLFREYEAHIKVDLCFQGFEKELAELPGEYARPSGRLLLAFDGGDVAGCGTFRRVDDGICEMKRLYVRPEHHGKRIGAALAQALIEQAKVAGYTRMRLDTMPSMQKAIALYRSIGFKEIASYRFNPVGGALFFELQLAEANFSRKS